MTPERIEEALERAARGLRAGRDFLNRIPLTSQRAIDREFIGLTLIPDGHMALDDIRAALREAQEALRQLDAGMQRALDPDDYVDAWLAAYPQGQPDHVRAALAVSPPADEAK